MGASAGAGEAVRQVVSDTGPILHLSEAGCLGLLARAGHVAMPPAVDTEVGCYLTDWTRQRPEWLKVVSLVPPHEEQARSWYEAGMFDAADAQAIALARQMGAGWLLTDDASARLFAESLGLEAHGSLGIVLWAAATGQIGAVAARAALDELEKSSLWVSARVMAEARAALGRLCP